MQINARWLVSIILAVGLVIALLMGMAGIIWWGNKISTQGSVIIGMIMGAIVIIGAAYLGMFLTSYQRIVVEQSNNETTQAWPMKQSG